MEIIPPIEAIDRSHKNIPIENIIEYAQKGLSLPEIAKLLGCSKQNVQQRLEAVGFNKEDLENFKNHRGDVLAFIQSKLLNSIDDETIKGMNPYQRIVGTGILFDKERLETGRSTQIIDTFELTARLEDLQKQREEILKRIEIRVTESSKHKEIKSDENT